MEFVSLTMVLQSALRLFLVILIILGFGVYGAVVGTTIPYLLIGIIGTAMLYVFIYKKLQVRSNAKLEIINNIKIMIKYGLPL